MSEAKLQTTIEEEILFYAESMEAIPAGILIVDKDCVIRYINPGWTKIRKFTRAEVIGRHMQEILTGGLLNSVLHTGRPILDINRKLEDTEYIVSVFPIKKGDEIIGAVSISNDINDVRRLVSVFEKSTAVINSQEAYPKGQMGHYIFDDIIGQSQAIMEMIQKSKKVARTDSSVLIQGESGTGKELFAQSIHYASNRRCNFFVAVNCAAIPVELLESELFGYEPGAFTGADKKGKIGLIQMADGGTIFLDEISDMPLLLQSKLLRVLQESQLRRVGATKVEQVDVRVIAATNRNIEELLVMKVFREDLYYRLNVIPLVLPPLRERREDILPLAEHYLSVFNRKFGKKMTFSREVHQVMEEYTWPGNVRELKNAVEYAINMTDGVIISAGDLPEKLRPAANAEMLCLTLNQAEMLAEEEIIVATLKQFGSSTTGKRLAAKVLGVSLASLYRKIKRLQQKGLLKEMRETEQKI